MSRRSGWLAFALVAAAFLILNRNAYRGYFSDDEFNTLSWISYAPGAEYLNGTLSPRFQENNFRPVGHYWFHLSEAAFGLDFWKYAAVLHALHLLNVCLLWLILNRLGARTVPAIAGCVFFALHMALFETFWKPMFVFDLLCGTLCLLSVLAWSTDRWILSFLSFWLAYKAKELAVMLPAVLLVYEVWFGRRLWKQLIPFFVASLSFGIQGLVLNPNKDNAYTFRFGLMALWRTTRYYAGRILLVNYIGLIAPFAAIWAPNRRTWFGLSFMGLLFAPLLVLPGRVSGAYCYAPFLGLAIAVSGVLEEVYTARQVVASAIIFLVWIPVDLRSLHVQSVATLRKDDAVRKWVSGVQALVRSEPNIKQFVFAGAPKGFAGWGVEGALKYTYRRLNLTVRAIDQPDAAELLRAGKTAVLAWDETKQRLNISVKPAISPAESPSE